MGVVQRTVSSLSVPLSLVWVFSQFHRPEGHELAAVEAVDGLGLARPSTLNSLLTIRIPIPCRFLVFFVFAASMSLAAVLGEFLDGRRPCTSCA